MVPNSSYDKDVAQFIAETRQNLNLFESTLLELEKNIEKRYLLNDLFRAVHSIKGAAGFLKFNNLEQITHLLENLLSACRDNKLEISPSHISKFLDINDYISSMLSHIESELKDYTPGIEEKIKELSTLSSHLFKNTKSVNFVSSYFPKKKKKLSPLQQKFLKTLNVKKTQTELNSRVQVNSHLLNNLGKYLAELTLLRNQFFELDLSDKLFANYISRLDLLTSNVNDIFIEIKTEPISIITSKLKRAVRDVAHELEKDVDFNITGDGIRLGKTMIEALSDPLLHLLRNAIDHGIETVEQRKAKGKNPIASINLEITSAKNWVYVSVIDDGVGIDVSRIKAKARRLNLFSEEDLQSFSNERLLNLIFEPGFSTKDKVTSLSGRGVGLDSVQKNISELSGVIEIDTKVDQGTKFTIRLPIKDSIQHVAIIKINNLSYAISNEHIVEFGVINSKQLLCDGAKTLLEFRGEVFTVIFAKDIIGDHILQKDTNIDSQDLEYIVIRSEETDYILVVDSVEEFTGVMVKPLNYNFKDSQLYSGSTILRDGQMVFLINTLEIARSFLPQGQKMLRLERRIIEEENDSFNSLCFELADGKKYIFKENIKAIIKPVNFKENDLNSRLVLNLSPLLSSQNLEMKNNYLVLFEYKNLDIQLEVKEVSFCDYLSEKEQFFSDPRFDFIKSKLNTDEGSIYKISLEEILKNNIYIENTQLLGLQSKTTEASKSTSPKLRTLQVVSFYINDYLFALPLEDIQKIEDVKNVNYIPIDNEILGVLNFKGEVVMIKDFASILGLESKPIADEKIILRNDLDSYIALAVEQLDSSIELCSDQKIDLDFSFPNSVKPFLTDVYERENSEKVFLLDAKKIFAKIVLS